MRCLIFTSQTPRSLGVRVVQISIAEVLPRSISHSRRPKWANEPSRPLRTGSETVLMRISAVNWPFVCINTAAALTPAGRGIYAGKMRLPITPNTFTGLRGVRWPSLKCIVWELPHKCLPFICHCVRLDYFSHPEFWIYWFRSKGMRYCVVNSIHRSQTL